MTSINATKVFFGLRSALRLNPYIRSQSTTLYPSVTSCTPSSSTRGGARTLQPQCSRAFATTSATSYSTAIQPDQSIPEGSRSMAGSNTASRPAISRSTFEKLHRLSALNPPPTGSEEETDLIEGLSDLIHLMDKVKSVQLPESNEARAGLLVEGIGIGEIIVTDQKHDLNQDQTISSSGISNDLIGSDELAAKGMEGETETRGKELLGWATNRVGDFYASRIKAKS